MLALPFVLLALALAMNLVFLFGRRNDAENNAPETENGLRRWLHKAAGLVRSGFGGWPEFVVVAICLGLLGFLNTWDFPIYLGVTCAAFALWRIGRNSSDWLPETILAGIGLGVVGFVALIPFIVGFRSQAGGILPNLFNPTKLQQFLVFFGLYFFVIVSYLIALTRKRCRPTGKRVCRSLCCSSWGFPCWRWHLQVCWFWLLPVYGPGRKAFWQSRLADAAGRNQCRRLDQNGNRHTLA